MRKAKNNNGFLFPPAIVEENPADKRASSHLRENRREPDQIHILEKFIRDVKINKQKITFVLMPASIAYKNSLPPAEELFSKIYKTAEKYNVEVVDFYSSTLFIDEDFYDFDHLNLVGAEKFSISLKEKLDSRM